MSGMHNAIMHHRLLFMENNARALKDASILDKMKLLKDNWQLVKSAKILGPHAQAFLELMTAPTAKILDKWWVKHKRQATQTWLQ